MEKNLGKFLKDLRTRNGYTQKELADILIVTPQTVSKWELNYSTPSLEILLEMSKLYGVTTDEIITCTFHKRLKEEHVFSLKNSLLYGIYAMMLAVGISLLFVDYFTVFSQYLQDGLLDVYSSGEDNISISISLDQYVVLVMTIFIPLFLLVLKLIDTKKILYLTGSILSAVFLLSHILPMVFSTYFITPEVGIVLHMVYVLLLILSIMIIIGDMGISLYEVIMKHPVEFVGVLLMIIISVLLPRAFYQYDYYGDMYYFSFSEELLLNVLFITPVLVSFKSVKQIKPIIQIYGFILTLAILFLALVYVFNSGLIFAGILLFTYLTALSIFFQEELQSMKFSINTNILPKFLYVVDAMIISTYLYLFLNDGDLFNRAGYSVRINDTVMGQSVYFLFFIYLGAMAMRYAKIKQFTKVMYFIFTIYLAYSTYQMVDEYFFNDIYMVTDGMLFLVPPMALGLYYIGMFIRNIHIVITKKDITYLNPLKKV